MKAEIEAAEHDAKALLTVSRSLNEKLTVLRAEGLPIRIVEAIEAAHSEVLRSAHLVASWVALQRNAEREPRSEWYPGAKR